MLNFTNFRNKPRIFIAYYVRSRVNPGDEPYHVAIIVRTHPADYNSDSTLRLHAKNKVVPPTATSEAKQAWEYEAKTVKFMTHQISGLLYLGKAPAGKSAEDIEQICARIPVPRDGEGEWRCTNWVWSALEVSGILVTYLELDHRCLCL